MTSSEIAVELKMMEAKGRLPAVVCFDYFDTLVTRTVFPQATKQLAAKQLAALLGNCLSWQTLYELRSGFEKRLCKESRLSGYDLEFSLDDLAMRMYDGLRNIDSYPEWIDKSHFGDVFFNIELKTELRVQEPCPEIFSLIQYLHEKGVALCLVSDFYMSRQQFGQMLEFHSIGNLFEEIFVSADFKLSKGGSGRLYKEVVRSMGCQAADMLMIGDNIRADHEMAKEAGLQTRHLDRSAQYSRYSELEGLRRNGNNSANHRTIENKFTDLLRQHKTPFFAEMGLSLWYFIHHLFLQLAKDNVADLFFCSKEGEFLKKLFTQYQEQCFGKEIIKCHYLLVSRKATFICSLAGIEEEDFSRLFCNYADISFKEFLLSLNFSEETSKEICQDHNLEYEKRQQDLRHNKQFAELTASKSFREKYQAHRLEQKKNLCRYIDGFGADIRKNGLALVDVGWKGSIQNNIFKSLDAEVVVRGYYIGSLSPTEIEAKNKKRGVLFCDVPEHSPYIHVFNNNRSLFEMLLGASHGSADGYFSKEYFADQKAARKSVELNCCGDDGNLVITGLDLPAERELYKAKIKPMQDTFLLLNYHLTGEYCLDTGSCPDLRWFARHHGRMVFRPGKTEVEFFSLLYHLENFGLFEFTDFQADKNIALSQRIKNLQLLLKNPGGILETGVWPPVILRRLGLGFLQPLEGMKRYRQVFKKIVK